AYQANWPQLQGIFPVQSIVTYDNNQEFYYSNGNSEGLKSIFPDKKDTFLLRVSFPPDVMNNFSWLDPIQKKWVNAQFQSTDAWDPQHRDPGQQETTTFGIEAKTLNLREMDNS